MINNSYSKKPACIVMIDNVSLLFSEASVINRNYYLSDTYTITAPLKANEFFNFNYWATVQKAEIKIYMGYQILDVPVTPEQLTLVFTGGLDKIELDPIRQTVEIRGRDYSYLLIDKKITKTYVNQTASQIATLFANENGLTPIVTPTFTPIGTYNQTYTQCNQGITEWDFLTFLAQQINYNLYVVNKELHFEPKPLPDAPAYQMPIQLAGEPSPYPVASVISLKFGRTLTLAEDVVVKVRSHSQLTGRSFTVTAKSHHVKDTPREPKQTYVYSYPNLTAERAQQIAQSQLRAITQHEMLLDFTMPVDMNLTKITPIQITGTFSAFDQVYYSDMIERTISFDPPQFLMTGHAKNHDTNSEVSI